MWTSAGARGAVNLRAEPHLGAIRHPARELAARRIDVVAARAPRGRDHAMLVQDVAEPQESCRAESIDSAYPETR